MRNLMPPPASRADSLFARLKRLLGLGLAPANGAGVRGERAAEEFLRRERGFTIVARNWRNPKDRREEIDLVARDGEVLVFVEVKARAANALVSGFHAVNRGKKAVRRRACAAYLRGLAEKPRTFRFDIVEVTIGTAAAGGTKELVASEREPEVRHYENVALFRKHFQL